MMYRLKPNYLCFAALTLILVFIVSGCYESGLGIFYSLEIERKLEDYSLENNLTIGAMAKSGSTYYVAAATVYKRGDTETNWEAISAPDGFNLSTSLAELNGSIYACYYNTAGTEYGLFKLSGDTWTEVTDTDVADAAKVMSVGGTHLIVSNRESATEYSYWFSSDGSAYDETGLGNAGSPVTDTAYDGTNFFLAIQDQVYSDTDTGADPDTFTPTNAAIDTNGVGGLYFVPETPLADDTLFASTKEGKVYYSIDNGDNWTEMTGTSSYALTDMVLTTTSGTEEVLLVGTQGNGYMEAVVETGDGAGDLEWKIIDRNSYSTDQNYLNTELSNAPVLGFYYDAGKDYVFAFTAGNGLWRNSQETTYRTWNIE